MDMVERSAVHDGLASAGKVRMSPETWRKEQPCAGGE